MRPASSGLNTASVRHGIGAVGKDGGGSDSMPTALVCLLGYVCANSTVQLKYFIAARILELLPLCLGS